MPASGQVWAAWVERLAASGDDDGAVALVVRADAERREGRVCFLSGVSVRLVVVHDAIGEDGVDGVAAACHCGTAGSVGFVADDGDAGAASWDGGGAWEALGVGEDDSRRGFCLC